MASETSFDRLAQIRARLEAADLATVTLEADATAVHIRASPRYAYPIAEFYGGDEGAYAALFAHASEDLSFVLAVLEGTEREREELRLAYAELYRVAWESLDATRTIKERHVALMRVLDQQEQLYLAALAGGEGAGA